MTTPTLTVTGVTSGMNNYVYRCLVSNSWGCADTTTSVLLTLGVDNIDNINAGETVSIYPNPTNKQLTITAGRIDNITISNVIGQMIYTHQYNSTQVQVDVADLQSGVYFLKVNGHEVRKFVKQ